MTKSELMDSLANQQSHLNHKDIELAVNCIIENMCQSLSDGNRIEVRGFGSFSLHYRPSRTVRNPKTDESVNLIPKYATHFKPGKELRNRVNASQSSKRAISS
jgi:integration host factor subunit beta